MNKNHITEIREREILKEKIIELLKKSEDQNKPIAIAMMSLKDYLIRSKCEIF
ncbi:hypothetical protein ACLGEP_05780 [Helicobacter pylori]